MSGITIKVLSSFFAIAIAFFSIFTAPASPQTQNVLTPVDDMPLKEDAEKTVTIHLLSSLGENSQSIQQAADMFCADRPNIRIHIHTVASQSDYRSTLRSKLLSGEQVDLFHIFSQTEARELQKYLARLSHLQWLKKARPQSLAGITLDDGLYGVPYSLEGYGLLYNTAIWEAAGINIRNIQNFEELEKAFEELRVQIRDNKLREEFPHLRAVTEFPAQDRSFLGEQISNMALFPDLLDSPTALATQILPFTGAQHAKDYVDLMVRCSSSRGEPALLAQIPRNRQLQTGLAAGRIAVIQDVTGVYKEIRAVDPQIADTLSFQPIPFPGEESAAVYADSPLYWGVNQTSAPEVQEAAAQFLEWLYTSPQGIYLTQNGLGILSPFPQSEDQEVAASNPLQKQLEGYIDAGRSRGWIYREFPQGFTQEVFATEIKEYLANQSVWKSFAQHCQEQWYRLR
ncbi:extracellular solute-binding protein [Oscillospiraceae bacterium MB08-C2-2]|nr:extracellular solute-binding protein [Oscillospiraceae bacterium MB08-C2-2]